jgi:MoaA/NifB/PqqE/SkfB family radical SAM enzyme
MSAFRRESWGRIEYRPDVDEFEAHIAREGSLVTVQRPLSAGILVTGKCNLECDFCYGNHESLPKTDISTGDWSRIFARLRSWGLMRVDISGGEPTLRCDLPEIAAAAESFGLAVVVSTNATVLNPERLIQFPRVRWHVSLDSGLQEIHEQSRQLRVVHTPLQGSLQRAGSFLSACSELGLATRALTCVGPHNREALFTLGEKLALWGVTDWNISRILKAGRAKEDYENRWEIENEPLLTQVRDLRAAYPFIRIRYSDRTEQDGYFLLVLPDGSLATQYTDGRDKVPLGNPLEMSLADLQQHPSFDLSGHTRKWITTELLAAGGDDRASLCQVSGDSVESQFGIL